MSPATGTGRLVLATLRRDRIVLPVWLVSITGLTAAVASALDATTGDLTTREATVRFSAANPITRIFDGPASGTDLGAMVMVEAYLILAILTAIMSLQAVTRHTRLEEETGRAELVGSTAVGRHARLLASLVVTLGANLVLGGCVAAVLTWAGHGGPGALAAGASIAATGWVFAAVAATAAQVLSTARATNAAAGAVLAGAFVLRAIGDLLGEVDETGLEVTSAWPSWLSPLGWGQQVRPFAHDHWWVLALPVATTVVLVCVAIALQSRRDVGLGMIAPRPGPARGAARLLSPEGLAWRLQRTVLLTWMLGLAAMGAAFGSVAGSVEDVVAGNEQILEMLSRLAPGASVTDLYVGFVLGIMAIATGAYTVQGLLRMRGEETSGRLEPVLASATGRTRWMAGHLGIVVGGALATLTLIGLAAGTTYALSTGLGGEALVDTVGGAWAQAPAVLALVGVVVALFGLLPRPSGPLAWALLAAALVMGQLGALLELPQWVLNLSPFTHVPLVHAEDLTLTPVLWLLAVAVGATAVGVAALRRRDLATPA